METTPREGWTLIFEYYWSIAGFIGLLWVTWAILKEVATIIGLFRAFFLAPWGISRINLKQYGEWAVVTGASQGIGRGYALELARQGLNVVIISRSESKLQKVKDEIEEKYKREVRIISIDFYGGQDVYPKVAKKLSDLDIGILVNNVGTDHDGPEFFSDIPADFKAMQTQYRTVELNCQTMTQMTKLVFPKMLNKNRGIIVNISSGSTVHPMQMATVVTATKSYIDFFSEGLRKECEGKGIIVQTVAPFFVATPLSGIEEPDLFVMDANKFAQAAVATIGVQYYTYGCLSHAIMGMIAVKIPTIIANKLIWKVMQSVKDHIHEKKSKDK